ncbi:Ribosomal protein L6 [Penicillium expansum]|nr:Ribosomal protein L6 [Penicillium expansum]
MSCSIPQRCARQLLREPFQRGSLPIFLAPAFSPAHNASRPHPRRSPESEVPRSPFPRRCHLSSLTSPRLSPGHEERIFLSEMTLSIPSFLTITPDETGQKASLSVLDQTVPHQRAMWGTIRALLQNHILGVSEGHVCVLSMVGVGYRATIEDKASTVQAAFPGQKFVSLKVGFSHPIELGIPQGVVASTPQPTRILLEGVDKRIVTQFAAEIREWRRPEPYKGKGIFVNGETIKLKAKKIK